MAKGMRTPKGPASPPYTNGPYEMSEAVVYNKPVIEGSDRYVLISNFERRPQLSGTCDAVYTTEAARNASLDFEILGTSAADADVVHGTTVAGIQMETAGADNDQVIVLPHLDSGQTAWTSTLWGTENQVTWEAVIKTNSAIATTLIWAGLKLTNTPIIATDDDQVYFRYSTDDTNTNWRIISSIAGTATNADSGIVVAASTIYYFRIEIDKDRQAHFFIDNREVYRTEALTNDIDLIPYVGVMALDTAAITIWLAKQKISRYIYE